MDYFLAKRGVGFQLAETFGREPKPFGELIKSKQGGNMEENETTEESSQKQEEPEEEFDDSDELGDDSEE